jgi:UDP-glucuronate 4-epimerase
LLELVKLIETALGQQARIEWLPPQPGDMQATYADISLAQDVLAYNPKVDITEGIPRFVAWYKAHRNLLAGVPK